MYIRWEAQADFILEEWSWPSIADALYSGSDVIKGINLGNKMYIQDALIRTSSVQRQERELGGRAPPDPRPTQTCFQEAVNHVGNNGAPDSEVLRRDIKVANHVHFLYADGQGTYADSVTVILHNYQWDAARNPVCKDGEYITAVVARIRYDDRSTTDCVLEIGKGGGEKKLGESGQLANVGNISRVVQLSIGVPGRSTRQHRLSDC